MTPGTSASCGRVLRGFLATAFLCGCGYDAYMDKFQNTLAKHDYNDKVETLLGQAFDASAKGIRLRLPKQAGSQVATEMMVPDVGDSVQFLFFRAPADVSKPIATAIFVSRKTEAAEAMSGQDLVAFALDPRRSAIWMGAGQEDIPGELETRNVPNGPKPREGRQPTMPVKWTSVKQHAITAGDNGAQTEVDYIWLLYILEQPGVTALLAYRVRQDDYAGTVSDALDFSVASATLIPGAGSASAASEPGEPKSAAPKAKRRRPG